MNCIPNDCMNMKNKLYGDGVHDDAPAIQELLDERKAEVFLPTPKKYYCIGTTLKIHGGQCLRMSPFTVIQLLPGSDVAMLEDDDFYTEKKNICIDGGIWDMNNINQSPNPYHFPNKNGETAYDIMKKRGCTFDNMTVFGDWYTGMCMRFCRVENLIIKNVTYKNPVTYGVQIGHINNFTFDTITFDYQTCNPKFWNMDGIHVEGHCKNGYIHNLKGACHDDMVALTADDSLYGPIDNIVVDGLYAEHCHSAVRLLSHGIPVKNIHISNVFGSYYVYCIGITKYHGPEEERGYMKNITIDHLYASTCEGTADVKGGYYPFIWVQKGVDVENLYLTNIERVETAYPTPMLQIDEGATVENMQLTNVKQA